MSAYEIKGKFAIVTGAGSGICLAFTKKLLEGGCSVVMADVKLRPEAQEVLDQWSTVEEGKPIAHFQQTDISDWAQISSLHLRAPLQHLLERPRHLPLAEDKVDCNPGVYKTFAVNTMGPIRLAQIAIDYWLENRNIEGNLLWMASLGGYVHSLQTPLYFASKAAIVSFVKSLATLKKRVGIRNAAICPGAVYTPIFHPEYCRDRVRPDDLTMTPEQCADVLMTVLTQPEYGDGNIVETMLIGTRDNPSVNVREVPLELLYPTVGPVGQDNHLLEEEEKLADQLVKHGMRN
ncbi:hypothetical protein MRS44_015195 [Fusarium solani]|uniref:uncharacterized protein n=1 Tax=Fusarium solani TaxID=169388 RepID=UPI0032C497B7|nr:hypothetical protein MRS44_015195 [Fusarium solani]